MISLYNIVKSKSVRGVPSSVLLRAVRLPGPLTTSYRCRNVAVRGGGAMPGAFAKNALFT